MNLTKIELEKMLKESIKKSTFWTQTKSRWDFNKQEKAVEKQSDR